MSAKPVDLSGLKAVPQEKWNALANKKIYFGHQSVGYNIIDGMNDIIREMPKIKLNIRETKDPKAFNQGIFAHSAIGRNCYPESKIDDFVEIIDSGVGRKADIAFFKFCYVDIVKDTDLDEIFKQYTRKVSQLEKKYPEVKFLHVTVPLQVANSPWKVFLKKMLGKSDAGEKNNIARNKFNMMILSKYGAGGKVFDLAKIESTYPGGKRQFFKCGNEKYYSLVPEFSDDGGHLNRLGKRVVAIKLLEFLLY